MTGEATLITIPCDSLAPVRVRRRLAELSNLGWVIGDAMLVATELVTNAVRHSMCHSQDDLVVSVSHDGDQVRICVRDPGISGGTARIVEDNDWFGGLGLRIVDQLASRWGSTRDHHGYEVWAQLPPAAQVPHEVRAPAVAAPRSQAAPH